MLGQFRHQLARGLAAHHAGSRPAQLLAPRRALGRSCSSRARGLRCACAAPRRPCGSTLPPAPAACRRGRSASASADSISLALLVGGVAPGNSPACRDPARRCASPRRRGKRRSWVITMMAPPSRRAGPPARGCRRGRGGWSARRAAAVRLADQGPRQRHALAPPPDSAPTRLARQPESRKRLLDARVEAPAVAGFELRLQLVHARQGRRRRRAPLSGSASW
jgi:hypothetical protein